MSDNIATMTSFMLLKWLMCYIDIIVVMEKLQLLGYVWYRVNKIRLIVNCAFFYGGIINS